jgi:hypothetical protein
MAQTLRPAPRTITLISRTIRAVASLTAGILPDTLSLIAALAVLLLTATSLLQKRLPVTRLLRPSLDVASDLVDVHATA